MARPADITDARVTTTARDGANAPRKRGRPADPTIGERRRREIVESAYRVFSTMGYTQAGIADIADDLDIGHGTVYRYFGGKREILDQVVDHVVELIATVVQEEVERAEAHDLEEFMARSRAIVGRLFTLVEQQPGVLRMIFFETTSIDEELTQRIFGLVDFFAAMTATEIEHGQEAGYIRRDLDARVAAIAFNSLVWPGLLSMLRDGASVEEGRATADGLLDFVRSGLAAR